MISIYKLITATHLRRNLVEDFMVEYGFDTHGRMTIRSIKPLRPNMTEETSLKFFENCNFICLDKKDAKNILSMLNESIRLLESGDRDDNDIEVFGDRAISYERLIDALNGTCSSPRDDDE